MSAYKASVGTQFAAGTELGIPVQDIVEANEMKQSSAQACCDAAAERAQAVGVTTQTHSVAGDAAEAILIGLWGVIDVGWLPSVPSALGLSVLPKRKP